jgi:hypothetical protein
MRRLYLALLAAMAGTAALDASTAPAAHAAPCVSPAARSGNVGASQTVGPPAQAVPASWFRRKPAPALLRYRHLSASPNLDRKRSPKSRW